MGISTQVFLGFHAFVCYKVVPPRYKRVIVPLNTDISPINHSYWIYKPTWPTNWDTTQMGALNHPQMVGLLLGFPH